MGRDVQGSFMLRLPGLRKFRERIRQLTRQLEESQQRVATLEHRLARAANDAEASKARAAGSRDAAKGREERLRRRIEAERQTRAAAAEATAKQSGAGPDTQAQPALDLQAPRKPHWRTMANGFLALKEFDRIRFMRQVGPGVPRQALVEFFTPEVGQLDFPDAPIVMRVNSPPERVRLRACAKEPWTIDWIRRVVRPGDVFYDIGANVGAYSLVAASRARDQVQVFAFEPSYANLTALCENVLLNDLSSSVIPLPIALSDRNGRDDLQLHSMLAGTAWHTLASSGPPLKPVVYRQPAVTFRLDDAIDFCGLPEPNHIKLDVDGSELGLLRGAERTLRSTQLRSLLIEIMFTTSDPVTQFLVDCGLRLERKIDCPPKSGEDIIWYGIFVRD